MPKSPLSTDCESHLRAIFRQTAANLQAASESSYVSHLLAAIDMLVEAFQSGHKVLIFGNGGSSSDAQHIAAELVGRFAFDRRALPAIALSSDQSTLTAVANDSGFAHVFERQIEAYGQPGDIAWAISTSGNSSNVVHALCKARAMGLRTIGLTGVGGGEMAPLCDVLLSAPVRETPRIQEIHAVSYHAICEAVEDRLFGTP